MKKKIFHNWGLKLVSLLVAFVLWFLAVQINDPPETVTFSGISVRLTNTNLLEEENKVYEIIDNSDVVRVTIRAPKSVTRDLRASDIVAVADVSKLTDINTIAISYSIQGVSSTRYDSIRGDHETVRLNVEESASKLIRVQSQTVGEVAEGYLVMSSSADQNYISVTGPESAVEKISYARVEVDVGGATNSMSLNVEPKLYDAEGNLLEFSNVFTNVNSIHMTVEVLAVKEVPVKLAVTGTPAEGYLATGQVECDTETVRIAGPATVIAGINSVSIPPEQLDITGAEGNVVNTVNIRDYLKDNVRLADSSFNGRVTVTVYVEPVVDRTIALSADDFEFVNIPEGYELELVEPDEGYKLTVSGLEKDVQAVQEDLIRGQVDVEAWLAEEEIEEPEETDYRIPVAFTLPEGVSPDKVSMEDEITITVRFIKPEEV
ncbi:MAG: CdaR family protein [Butyrivibrio sp.]|nr:CdaR family protein [Acetatifactor muris]MCM1559200.1 CdaR family protein [Butyrivibrio sp.]